jgi:1-acyl-sn-glycerol-3-phosphate acyltransferase
MLYYLGCFLFRVFFKIFCRWEVEGREHIPRSGGFILAPNHVSYLDPPLAGAAMTRPVYFMAKSELFASPIFGRIIRQTHAFPVSRGGADRQALKKAQQLLQDGQVVVVFPEGRRSEDGRLQEAELGLALIAARAGVPVVPVAFIGVDRVLPRGKIFPRPGKVKVQFGAPVCLDLAANARISREALQPFMDKIMSALRAMLPEGK